MKRICHDCQKPILKAHRWHQVHRRFLFWKLTYVVHRNCSQPELAPVKRIKGPLPFPESAVN